MIVLQVVVIGVFAALGAATFNANFHKRWMTVAGFVVGALAGTCFFS